MPSFCRICHLCQSSLVDFKPYFPLFQTSPLLSSPFSSPPIFQVPNASQGLLLFPRLFLWPCHEATLVLAHASNKKPTGHSSVVPAHESGSVRKTIGRHASVLVKFRRKNIQKDQRTPLFFQSSSSFSTHQAQPTHTLCPLAFCAQKPRKQQQQPARRRTHNHLPTRPIPHFQRLKLHRSSALWPSAHKSQKTKDKNPIARSTAHKDHVPQLLEHEYREERPTKKPLKKSRLVPSTSPQKSF